MWCIPALTPEFIERMEHILDLYAQPYNPQEPLLCFDEKSLQLLEDSRTPLPTKTSKPRRRDYEYIRRGMANIFVTVEPKKGYRTTQATERRTRQDFAHEIKRIVNLPRYKDATCIHFVLDNLNIHSEKSLVETLGEHQTNKLMQRIQFHYTPKHASWLNMAEIEIGILNKQCLKRRLPTLQELKNHMYPWQQRRNRHEMKIQWRWTKKDARKVFKYTPTKLI